MCHFAATCYIVAASPCTAATEYYNCDYNNPLVVKYMDWHPCRLIFVDLILQSTLVDSLDRDCEDPVKDEEDRDREEIALSRDLFSLSETQSSP